MRTEKSMTSYVTLSNRPWLQIPMDKIKRIDRPPINEIRDHDQFYTRPKAICVVTTDGNEIWSDGDRSWREREREQQLNFAYFKLTEARENYRKVLSE